jgi:hypothetical protein
MGHLNKKHPSYSKKRKSRKILKKKRKKKEWFLQLNII